MQERKADHQRFSQDKPGNCTGCYFWNRKTKACTEEQCYYLLPDKTLEGKNGDCGDCPYGRYSPCIGYCLLKILQEMRQERKKSEKKEGDCYAGGSK